MNDTPDTDGMTEEGRTTRGARQRGPEDTAVIRKALGVALATGVYGITAGALAVAAGLSVLQAMALSLLLFSGGSQFAFFGVIGAGGSPVAAVASSTLLGVRNGFYGLQVSQLLGVHRWARPVAAHFTIDESTAVAVTQTQPRQQRIGFWVTGVGIFALWNLTTFVGAVAGGSIGDPRTYGLDAAAAAAFVGLLWPRLRGRDPLAVAALAVVITVVSAPFVPAGVPVLAAVLAALVVGLPARGPRSGVVAP
ncbi:AzlC family ABC transporter permease [Ornithinimicrobium cavernae]|uniref:AzlC family ABC transporter permease n=1 Tax=Ornithinimicrobium cavernae TaxID=2666047 RepID=UPI001F1E3103|nr:AzlC family ABC transporter permease [Ornithinimicrobium cavernae]